MADVENVASPFIFREREGTGPHKGRNEIGMHCDCRIGLISREELRRVRCKRVASVDFDGVLPVEFRLRVSLVNLNFRVEWSG